MMLSELAHSASVFCSSLLLFTSADVEIDFEDIITLLEDVSQSR